MANRSQEACWTISDLKEQSELISSGNPIRYRLPTTRSDLDESGKVRKWTFGQRNMMQNKIILLVGQTGTGKTTLINAILNDLLGTKDTDGVWFEITADGGVNDDESQTVDQSESQTNEITVYEVFVQSNPVSVTIIDTPGYGDTRGAEHDKEIAQNLWKLFENDSGVKEIDAVCLVVKASDNRLADRENYIFDAILSLFGKDIEKNIVVFVTHSDGGRPGNVLNAIKKAKIPCRKENGAEPVHFLLNNRQAEPIETLGSLVYGFAWRVSENGLKKFFASLEEHSRKSLVTTEKVLAENLRLKACVSNLQERIEFKESKHKELTMIQKALKENQEKIEKKEDFSFAITRHYKEKVGIENASWWDRNATCCSVCKENCHEYNCWCAFHPSVCEVIKHKHCTVCKGKCHYRKHVRENKKYVIKTETIQMTYNDLIKRYFTIELAADSSLDALSLNDVEKYHEMKNEQKENVSVENALKNELEEIEKEKNLLLEEACSTILELSEIALKPNSDFIIRSLEFLITRAEEAEDHGWVLKLKQLREARM